MKIKKTHLIATIILVACFTSLGVQAAPRSTPVTVVNGQANPVPVTGEVRATVQGNVNVVNEVQVNGQVAATVQGAVEVTRGSISIDNDSANPVPVVISDPVQVNVGTNYRYIGNTSSVVTADRGVDGFNRNCQAMFGAPARMCTSKEYFQGTGVPSLSPGDHWILPIVTDVYYDPIGNRRWHTLYTGGIIFGASGLTGSITCHGYTTVNAASNGAVLRRNFGTGATSVGTSACDLPHTIVCCLPQ